MYDLHYWKTALKMAYWPWVQWDIIKRIRLEINIYFSSTLEVTGLLSSKNLFQWLCSPGNKIIALKFWDLLKRNVLSWFKAMLVAQVRSLVPFNQQCQRGVKVGDGGLKYDLCSYLWGDCQDNWANFLLYF